MRIFTSLTDPQLITMIKAGAVGVLPTDTLYGLVADAHSQAAVTRMYALKNRERKPGTSIAASTSQLIELGLPEETISRVAYLWPNPISVVIVHNLAYIHQGLGDSPFRVVGQSDLADLLVATGPLTTSSANLPGANPARTIAEAQAYFADTVDFYVDGGDIGERPPSTVVGLRDDGVVVYRMGAVQLDEDAQIVRS